ncbi:hypothetical protein C8J57DRAFT_1245905 [Mycena rebaudengoi]|nr:hypothetical protein C8J57DRAFT_1245905 [Mycena rebaudengoi]
MRQAQVRARDIGEKANEMKPNEYVAWRRVEQYEGEREYVRNKIKSARMGVRALAEVRTHRVMPVWRIQTRNSRRLASRVAESTGKQLHDAGPQKGTRPPARGARQKRHVMRYPRAAPGPYKIDKCLRRENRAPTPARHRAFTPVPPTCRNRIERNRGPPRTAPTAKPGHTAKSARMEKKKGRQANTTERTKQEGTTDTKAPTSANESLQRPRGGGVIEEGKPQRKGGVKRDERQGGQKPDSKKKTAGRKPPKKRKKATRNKVIIMLLHHALELAVRAHGLGERPLAQRVGVGLEEGGGDD